MSSPPKTEYKDYKPTSDLPPLKSPDTSIEYKVQHVLLWAFLTFLAHGGAFFGCFFGIRGPDGEWPHAWWSFCFLGNAITQFVVYLTQNPAVVVRHAESFEFKNYFGHTIGEPGPFSCYEAVALVPGCTGLQAAILRTDEHMANMKSQHPWCACCIGKQMVFDFEDVGKFATDHGMSVDGTSAGGDVKFAEVDVEAVKA